MNLYNFDASALVDLWDNYPMQTPVFKNLWGKFTENVENNIFVISDMAIKEVRNVIQKTPASVGFINILDKIKVIKKDRADLSTAQSIKDLLEIEEDGYGEGVGENDIFIIAIAKRTQATLITNENRQPRLPQNKSKYKIPTVCNLPEVNVANINLTELLHKPDLWEVYK